MGKWIEGGSKVCRFCGKEQEKENRHRPIIFGDVAGTTNFGGGNQHVGPKIDGRRSVNIKGNFGSSIVKIGVVKEEYSEKGKKIEYGKTVIPKSIRGIGTLYHEESHIDRSTTVDNRGGLIQRSTIGDTEERIGICPYCGKELNFPKAPKFCPYCREQIIE